MGSGLTDFGSNPKGVANNLFVFFIYKLIKKCMNNMLNKVQLEKTDTCLTYVLKRLGEEPNLCTYENFHEYFNQHVFSRLKDSIKIGDILLWDKDVKWEWLPWSIDEKGVRWKNVAVKFHFGIYEGEGTFSDTTRLVRIPHPSIRLRSIKDVKRNPDWILRKMEG